MSRQDVIGLPKPKPQPEPDPDGKDATVLPFERPRKRRTCSQEGCDNPHAARGRCQRCYRLWRKTNGNHLLPCTKCGQGRRWQNHSWCRECCYADRNARFTRRYNTDPAFYSARRMRNMEANFRLKVEVINGYAAVTGRYGCFCCGEQRFSMLQLDHVRGNGAGAEERRAYNGWWQGVYRRAIREGFPDDLRVACANCNASLAALGRCEHQGGEVDAAA